jgi:predicted enzyme related to lactoylglutathione lyase
MAFQPAPDGDAAPGTRLRVDVEVQDLDPATAQIERLGGALVRVVRFRPGEEHRVMADPEGNEFNIVLPFPPGSTS